MVKIQNAILRVAFLAGLSLSLGIQKQPVLDTKNIGLTRVTGSNQTNNKNIENSPMNQSSTFDVMPKVPSERLIINDAMAKSYGRPEGTRRTLRSVKRPEPTIRKAASMGTRRKIQPATLDQTRRKVKLEESWRHHGQVDPASSIMAQVGRTHRRLQAATVASSREAKVSKGYVATNRKAMPSSKATGTKRKIEQTQQQVKKRPAPPPPPPSSSRKYTQAKVVPAKPAVLIKAEKKPTTTSSRKDQARLGAPRYGKPMASGRKPQPTQKQPVMISEVGSSEMIPATAATLRRGATMAGGGRKQPKLPTTMRKVIEPSRMRIPARRPISSEEEDLTESESQSTSEELPPTRYNKPTTRKIEVVKKRPAKKQPQQTQRRLRGRQKEVVEDDTDDYDEVEVESTKYVPTQRTLRRASRGKPSKMVIKKKKKKPARLPSSSTDTVTTEVSESSSSSSSEYVPTRKIIKKKKQREVIKPKPSGRVTRRTVKKPAPPPPSESTSSDSTDETSTSTSSSSSSEVPVATRRKGKGKKVVESTKRRAAAATARTTRKVVKKPAATTRRAQKGTKTLKKVVKGGLGGSKSRKDIRQKKKKTAAVVSSSESSSSSDFFDIRSSSGNISTQQESSQTSSTTTYVPQTKKQKQQRSGKERQKQKTASKGTRRDLKAKPAQTKRRYR